MVDIFKIIKNNDFEGLKNNLKYIRINTRDMYSNTLLHYAVMNKNLEITRFLILNNIDVNALNKDMYSALHLAVLNNSIALFKVLIKAGTDINLLDKDNESALMLAIKYNRNLMVDILLSLHANIDYVNNKGENAICLSAYSGTVELFEFLYNANPKLLYSRNNEGDTLLHIACKSMNIDVVKKIVELKFPLNFLNNNLETALYACARNCDYDCTRILLKSGAFIEFKNKYDESILDVSSTRFKDFLISKTNESFYINYKSNFPLSFAIITNNNDLFDRYLNKYQLNKKDGNNLSALNYAQIYYREYFIKRIKELK